MATRTDIPDEVAFEPASNPDVADKRIGDHLPYPIAAAWQRVLIAQQHKNLDVRHVHAVIDITNRTLIAMFLPDYLRGRRAKGVEDLFELLNRPADGTVRDLLRELVRAIRERGGPTPFMPEAYDWLFIGEKKPTRELELLDRLITLRNRYHKPPEWTDDDLAREVRTRLDLSRRLLRSLAWLGNYTMFRVIAPKPTRQGHVRGPVQLFRGRDLASDRQTGEFTAKLVEDAVYVANATGSELLEVSPLVHVGSVEGTGEERVLVFKHADPKGRLVLVDDISGRELTRFVERDDEELTLSQWLARKDPSGPTLPNDDLLGVLQQADRVELIEGDVIAGRYEVLSQLGSGGMGNVYRVRDRDHDEERALKLMHEELVHNREAVERFKRAPKLHRKVKNRHVLREIEYGESHGDRRPFLLMPVFGRGTLRDVMERGPGQAQAEPDVYRWALGLLDALSVLHAEGIVHRDVKPSNILLDDESEIVLTDFDVAKGKGDISLTQSGRALGSLPYLAPEVINGSPATDKSDVYSAGLVLDELLRGKRERESAGQGLVGPLGDTVRRMTSRKPEDRPTASGARKALVAAWGAREEGSRSGEGSRSSTKEAVSTAKYAGGTADSPVNRGRQAGNRQAGGARSASEPRPAEETHRKGVDTQTLRFFVERGFRESAEVMLDELTRRFPNDTEILALRPQVEKMSPERASAALSPGELAEVRSGSGDVVPEPLPGRKVNVASNSARFDCPACGKAYRVPAERLVAARLQIRCPNCGTASLLNVAKRQDGAVLIDGSLGPHKKWFRVKNLTRLGPFTLAEMRDAAAQGEIVDDTLVWNASMSEWAKAITVPEIKQLLPKGADSARTGDGAGATGVAPTDSTRIARAAAAFFDDDARSIRSMALDLPDPQKHMPTKGEYSKLLQEFSAMFRMDKRARRDRLLVVVGGIILALLVAGLLAVGVKSVVAPKRSASVRQVGEAAEALAPTAIGPVSIAQQEPRADEVGGAPPLVPPAKPEQMGADASVSSARAQESKVVAETTGRGVPPQDGPSRRVRPKGSQVRVDIQGGLIPPPPAATPPQQPQLRPPAPTEKSGADLYKEGRELAAQGRIDEAIATYKLALGKGQKKAHGQLARQYFMKGDKGNCARHAKAYVDAYSEAGDAIQMQSLLEKCGGY